MTTAPLSPPRINPANVFICNPVTGRVHRDKLKVTGSTYLVDTQPDFITCDDPIYFCKFA